MTTDAQRSAYVERVLKHEARARMELAKRMKAWWRASKRGQADQAAGDALMREFDERHNIKKRLIRL